jgi:hypothetical protein
MLKWFLFSLAIPWAAFAGIKDVRIAQFSVDKDFSEVPDDYLVYARQNGYNYILAVVGRFAIASGPNEWINPSTNLKDGTYNLAWAKNNPGSPSLYRSLKDLFSRADSKGLKLIPCVNMRGRWAGYPGTWTATNTNIKTNDGYGMDPSVLLHVPVFFADPNGLDKSFESYLNVVKAAFNDAHVSYPNLEYVHLGGDEMYFDVPGTGTVLIAGYSNTTEKGMVGNDLNNTYSLIAGSINRDVTKLKSILPNTMAMMYGDMFDPKYNGMTQPTYYQNGTQAPINRTMFAKISTGNVLVEPKRVLDRSEITQTVKDNLVLMPWMYSNPLTLGNSVFLHYDANAALSFFKSKGFKVIPAAAIDPSNDPSPNLAYTHQMNDEWVLNSKRPEYSGTVRGIASQSFVGTDGQLYWSTTPRSKIFEILPEIAKKAGFFPIMSPMYTALFN